MRTLKTLVAFGVLLLATSAANATVSFSLTALNNGGPQEVDLNVTLAGAVADDIVAFGFDWLLNGAAIPLSVVQLPAGGSPNGPLVDTTFPCDVVANQFMCTFAGFSPVGSLPNNDVGDAWTWDTTPANMVDGTHYMGRFTFTDLASGSVSIGNCELITSNIGSVPCSSGSASLTAIPEPTTAALLGLGLFGLVIGGRRR